MALIALGILTVSYLNSTKSTQLSQVGRFLRFKNSERPLAIYYMSAYNKRV